MEGRGKGRLSPWSGDYGEPAPPKKGFGASPLNSLNLNVSLSEKVIVGARWFVQKILLLLNWRNRRLPCPPQINSPVSPSIRPSVCEFVRCLYMPADQVFSGK